MEPKAEQQQQDSTQSFCDMLYSQLVRIENEDVREMLQFEIHAMVMHHKAAGCSRFAVSQPVPSMPTDTSLSVRNNFVKHEIMFDKHTARQNHITAFYQLDKASSIRLAPELTDRHIYFSNQERCESALQLKCSAIQWHCAVAVKLFHDRLTECARPNNRTATESALKSPH